MKQVDLMEYVDNYHKHTEVESILIHGDPNLCPYPYISIVIPAYKRPDFLKIALDSALNQNDPVCSYEVVVVDNEETDGKQSETQRLIQKYNNPMLLYYRNERIRGMVGNWNRGIQLSRGQWIAFLHDDDILIPDYINRISRLLMKNKAVAGISALFSPFGGDDNIRYPNTAQTATLKSRISDKLCKNKLMRMLQVDSIIMLTDVFGAPTCGSIFRRETLIESGGFNDFYYPSFDWFFLYKYCKKYKHYQSMEIMGYYRAYGNTSSMEMTKVEFLRDRIMFLERVSSNTRIGRVIRVLFRNEQNIRILNVNFVDHNDEIVSDYFEKNEIMERKVRNHVYNFLVKRYWQVKRYISFIIG